MNDVEKNRAEYVTHLELQVQNLQRQLVEIKADEKWVPKFGAELNNGQAKLTLSFGGKNQTAVFSYEYLDGHSAGDATTGVLELGFQEFVNDRLRSVVQPEIERLKQGVQAISGAGKW